MSASSDQAGARAGQGNRAEHHRCAHVTESGVGCNATTATGKRLCHAHQRYNDADPLYPIQVPLLEDAASIRFVVSQTSRQLAMGAIPPANGRAMLYGCRMALDLLLYEQSMKKLQREQEKMERKLAAAASQPVSELAGQPVSELADATVASEMSVESPLCKSGADMGQAEEAESATDLVEACAAGAEPEAEPVPLWRRREPRFADLRGQWDKAMGRLSRELSANLTAAKDEDGEAWRERMKGPLQAGHPQTRQAHRYMQNAIAAGRSADASAYSDRPVSELGPGELPFNPACPPQYHSDMMDDWREEHIAAWYRCLMPNAGEKEVRDYASSIYKGIQEEKAEAAAQAASTDAEAAEAVPAAS
jgi:hypothetical protein